ncbi:hypothetical protein V6N13_077294 [Hibiscus sabdariffa]|uniref:Uncharacterized protein n=1 Tax=Hibiscus sabdariffa TaxID=183260 RepID=A0ABR2CNF6_9ROSI
MLHNINNGPTAPDPALVNEMMMCSKLGPVTAPWHGQVDLVVGPAKSSQRSKIRAMETNQSKKEVDERPSEIVAVAGMCNVESNEDKAVWRELLSPLTDADRQLWNTVFPTDQRNRCNRELYPIIFMDVGI